jgi:hypothetical protein
MGPTRVEIFVALSVLAAVVATGAVFVAETMLWQVCGSGPATGADECAVPIWIWLIPLASGGLVLAGGIILSRRASK